VTVTAQRARVGADLEMLLADSCQRGIRIVFDSGSAGVQLVRARMAERGWSYSDLERRSGRALSRGRWQQMGSGVAQK